MDWTQKQFNLELEVDKIYRYVAFSQRKKNYFGILESGFPDVKGLVGKRKSTPALIKNAFYDSLDVLKSVYNEQDFEEAKEKVKEIISATEKKIISKDLDINDLAISTTLSKSLKAYTKTTPPHVKAGLLLEQTLQRQIQPGETIRYVKTNTKLGVKPIELTKKEELDTTEYLKVLTSVFGQFLDVLGVEDQSRGGYSSLDSFM